MRLSRTPRPAARLPWARPVLLTLTLALLGGWLTPLRAAGLSEKESFMLLFGKGNGAMRTLCALERDGVISQEQRRRYQDQLMDVLLEPADDATARRNLRVGMAFAVGRASLCSPIDEPRGQPAGPLPGPP